MRNNAIQCEKMARRRRTRPNGPIILTPCPMTLSQEKNETKRRELEEQLEALAQEHRRLERTLNQNAGQSRHLDLGRAPYVLYGVKYIDLVPLMRWRKSTAA